MSNRLIAQERGEKELEIQCLLHFKLKLLYKDFKLKRQKRNGRLQWHLWIHPEVVADLGIGKYGLHVNSGYRDLDDIQNIVKEAVQKYEAGKTSSATLSLVEM